MKIKKLVITPSNYIYKIEHLNRSISLHEGHIDREALINIDYEGIVETSKGEKLLLAPATFKDQLESIKRKAAIIIPKDLGFIISETGLTKESVILDVGGGSGAVTCQLAALCKKVYSFDINPEHVKVIKTNCEDMELNNVELKELDIKKIKFPETIPEQVDLAVIDVPEPLEAIPMLDKVVKQSGFIVFYTPHISQAQQVVEKLDSNYKIITVIELIQRRWEVENKLLRPKHNMLGHTAFLTIVRKFLRP